MGKVLQFDLHKKRQGQAKEKGSTEARFAGLSEAAALIPFSGSGAGHDELETATFAGFVQQVKRREVVMAGETLSFLLGITQDEGVRCTATFADRLGHDSSLTDKVQSLYNYVKAHKANDCLMLLALCFDLHGARAINVLQHLKAQAS